MVYTRQITHVVEDSPVAAASSRRARVGGAAASTPDPVGFVRPRLQDRFELSVFLVSRDASSIVSDKALTLAAAHTPRRATARHNSRLLHTSAALRLHIVKHEQRI